jgi:thiol:disulfide interchange protein DsbD
VGIASIVAGLWLIAKPAGKSCGAVTPAPSIAPLRLHRRKADSLPPLFLGAALSLTPCMPLASLLALAANTGNIAAGASYGLAFGLGTAITPILVLVPLAGRLGRALRSGRVWMMRCLLWCAAIVLVALGIRRLLLAF